MGMAPAWFGPGTPEQDLMPMVPFGHVMRGELAPDVREQIDLLEEQFKDIRKRIKQLRRGTGKDQSDDSTKRDADGDANDSEASLQEKNAPNRFVVERLPEQTINYLASPPVVGRYGPGYYYRYNVGPRYRNYRYRISPYSYSYGSRFYYPTQPYYYGYGGRYYYSYRPPYYPSPYFGPGIRIQVGPLGYRYYR
jgi:hypothetical protein